MSCSGDAASPALSPAKRDASHRGGPGDSVSRDGQYQLYCVRLTPEGAGDLAVAFEQMKARLLQEGPV